MCCKIPGRKCLVPQCILGLEHKNGNGIKFAMIVSGWISVQEIVSNTGFIVVFHHNDLVHFALAGNNFTITPIVVLKSLWIKLVSSAKKNCRLIDRCKDPCIIAPQYKPKTKSALSAVINHVPVAAVISIKSVV